MCRSEGESYGHDIQLFQPQFIACNRLCVCTLLSSPPQAGLYSAWAKTKFEYTQPPADEWCEALDNGLDDMGMRNAKNVSATNVGAKKAGAKKATHHRAAGSDAATSVYALIVSGPM